MEKWIANTKNESTIHSCHSSGVFSRTSLFSNQNHYPLIHRFLNRHVKVKVDVDFEVSGMLIHYQENSKDKPHRPTILILKNGEGIHVLRGDWINVTEVE